MPQVDTAGLDPCMTLGPGGVGGAITGDNIGVRHLFTVKSLAYGIREAPVAAMTPGTDAEVLGKGGAPSSEPDRKPAGVEEIEGIAQRVLAELRKRHIQ
ncbi:hypothetical protein MASR2M78_29700 [Treponema sp.]